MILGLFEQYLLLYLFCNVDEDERVEIKDFYEIEIVKGFNV